MQGAEELILERNLVLSSAFQLTCYTGFLERGGVGKEALKEDLALRNDLTNAADRLL